MKVRSSSSSRVMALTVAGVSMIESLPFMPAVERVAAKLAVPKVGFCAATDDSSSLTDPASAAPAALGGF